MTRKANLIGLRWLIMIAFVGVISQGFISDIPRGRGFIPDIPRRRGFIQASANVIYSERFLDHKVRGYHPENYQRVQVPAQRLKDVQGIHILPPKTSKEEALAAIRQVHSSEYIERIKSLCEKGSGYIDADTYVNEQTYDVCLEAAAAWIDAAKMALSGAGPAFALTRPPGHHALRDSAMGFCIFGFAAITARYALDKLGCKRVAIIDWDAHQGNGVAAFANEEPRLRYCSLHQEGAFPMTGRAEDRGINKNVLNIPVSAYTAIDTFLPLFETKAIPFLQEWNPDLVIVSAGYDSLGDDPLAQLMLSPSDYKVLSQKLKDVFGANKLAFGLEGGYDPDRIAQAIEETLRPFLP